MSKLLYAVEEVIAVDDDTEDAFNEEMLAILEATNELDSRLVDLDDDFRVMDDIEASIERLEGIRNAIQKYGIDRPMMEAVDPNGELVTAGLCCSYEKLGQFPVMDINADAAIEGIGEAIATTVKHIKSFLKMIGNKFKDIGIAWRKSVFMFSRPLEKYKGILQHLSVDEAKFSATEIRTLSKPDFDGVVTAIDKLFSVMNGENVRSICTVVTDLVMHDKDNPDNIAKFRKKIGAFFKPLENDKGIEHYLKLSIRPGGTNYVAEVRHEKGERVNDSRKTANAGDWKAGDVGGAIDDALRIMTGIDNLFEVSEDLSKLCDKLADMTGEYHMEHNVDFSGSSKGISLDVSAEKVHDYGKLLSCLHDFIDDCWSVMTTISQPMVEVASSALQLARAAEKCKA